MRNIITTIIIFIVWTFFCFSGGYLYQWKFGNKPKPVIIEKEIVKYNTIYKDYAKMTDQQKNDRLFHYDRDTFNLDILKIKDSENMFRLTGNLYERQAQRDVKIECSKSGNFKFYVGVTAITIGVSYGIYRLIKK